MPDWQGHKPTWPDPGFWGVVGLVGIITYFTGILFVIMMNSNFATYLLYAGATIAAGSQIYNRFGET